MELRLRPRVSGPRMKPRATSVGRGRVGKQENLSVARETLVDVPSSAIMTMSGSEELPSRVSPVQGGVARSFVPLARSESAGEAIRPPKGYPSRRWGSSLQLGDETPECGDAGGVGTIALRPTAALAVSWAQFLPPDEGANSTPVLWGWRDPLSLEQSFPGRASGETWFQFSGHPQVAVV